MDATGIGNSIQVFLTGSPEDGGAVRADDLYRFLQQWLQALAAVERELTGAERAKVEYRVVALSYASPVCITLQPFISDPKVPTDIPSEVVSRFARDIRVVTGELDTPGADIDQETLEALEGLYAPLKKHVRSIEFAAEDRRVPITHDFDKRIRQLMGRNVYRTRGTFRGRLEAVNIHNRPWLLNIFPAAGPRKVRCVLRAGVLEDVRQLLGDYVEVVGHLRFRGDAPHPFEVDVLEIRPLPKRSSLPKFTEIVGSMPGLTGEFNSVEFVQVMRDAEED